MVATKCYIDICKVDKSWWCLWDGKSLHANVMAEQMLSCGARFRAQFSRRCHARLVIQQKLLVDQRDLQTYRQFNENKQSSSSIIIIIIIMIIIIAAASSQWMWCNVWKYRPVRLSSLSRKSSQHMTWASDLVNYFHHLLNHTVHLSVRLRRYYRLIKRFVPVSLYSARIPLHWSTVHSIDCFIWTKF